MPRSRASIAAAACLVTCTSLRAHAAVGRFELEWSAPVDCETEAGIGRRVERILNRPLSVRDGEVLAVRASVDPPERELPWRVVLEIDNGQRHSSRSLEAASCDELASATALLIAILLEPNADLVEASSPSEPAEKRASLGLGEPAHVREPQSLPPQPQAVRFALGGFVGAMSGLVPGWSFGAGGEGTLAWRALRWRSSLAYFFPVERAAPDADAQGARFWLLSADSKLCLVQPSGARVSAGLCAGAGLASLHARGYGAGLRSSAEQANFISLLGGAQLVWAASDRLGLVLDAEAVLPLGSRRFVFEGSSPAQIFSPGAGMRLALAVQFWLGKTENQASGPGTRQ